MACDRWIEPGNRRRQVVEQVATHLEAADGRYRRRQLMRRPPVPDPR
jgi:hypothetical protein